MTDYKVGDAVEWTDRGVIHKINVQSDATIFNVLPENGLKTIPFEAKSLTKVTPPFPTKPGSVIKASQQDREKILFLVDDETPFWKASDGSYFYECSLELISVEYEPGE